MCHCIFFGINPRVSEYHAFRYHRATVKQKLALTVEVTIFVLDTFDLLNAARKRHHRAAFNPFLNRLIVN